MTKTRTKRKSAVSIIAKRAKDIRKHLVELSKTIDTSYVKLAKELREVYKKEYYKEWNYGSTVDYASAELNIEQRKCQTLIQIADKMDELKISDSKAAALGWSKMREIVKVATLRNLDKWMKEAKTSSVRELMQKVSVVRKNDPNAKIPQLAKIGFSLGEGGANIVLEALGEAKAMCGSEDDNIAIEMICQDWMEVKGASPTKVSLKDRIAFIEKNYDVKLKAVGGAGGGCEKEEKKPATRNPGKTTTKAKVKAKTKATKKAKGKGSPIKAKTGGKGVQVVGKATPETADDLFKDDPEDTNLLPQQEPAEKGSMKDLFGM